MDVVQVLFVDTICQYTLNTQTIGRKMKMGESLTATGIVLLNRQVGSWLGVFPTDSVGIAQLGSLVVVPNAGRLVCYHVSP